MGGRSRKVIWGINKSDKIIGGLEVCVVVYGPLFVVSTFIYDGSMGF